MRITIAIAALFLSASASAQTPAPAQVEPSAPATVFTIETKAMGSFSGNKETPLTDVGAMLKLTRNFSIRSDNLVGPDGQAFLNGAQYHIPFEKLLKGTTLDSKQFEFYVVGQAGAARTPKDQKFSISFGGGLNYSPTADGKFGVNIFEVRFVSRFPGPVRIGTATVVASGINLRF